MSGSEKALARSTPGTLARIWARPHGRIALTGAVAGVVAGLGSLVATLLEMPWLAPWAGVLVVLVLPMAAIPGRFQPTQPRPISPHVGPELRRRLEQARLLEAALNPEGTSEDLEALWPQLWQWCDEVDGLPESDAALLEQQGLSAEPIRAMLRQMDASTDDRRTAVPQLQAELTHFDQVLSNLDQDPYR